MEFCHEKHTHSVMSLLSDRFRNRSHSLNFMVNDFNVSVRNKSNRVYPTNMQKHFSNKEFNLIKYVLNN